MSEHTPTPWHLENDGESVMSADNVEILWCPPGSYQGSDWPDNSAFIVKAVNCHDDLVSALSGIIAVADRNTIEFERARSVLQSISGSLLMRERSMRLMERSGI